jgi:hypothetical protein
MIKQNINQFLRFFNLKIETLVSDNAEALRLDLLDKSGNFKKQIFPIAECFNSNHYREITDEVKLYVSDLAKLDNPVSNTVGYSYDNSYFSSPDAEVLYSIIRKGVVA